MRRLAGPGQGARTVAMIVALLVVAAPPAAGDAPESSLRPVPRPVLSFTPPVPQPPPADDAAVVAALAASAFAPRSRSDAAGTGVPASMLPATRAVPRPAARPAGLERRAAQQRTAAGPVRTQSATPAAMPADEARPARRGLFSRGPSRAGSVCGVRSIRGREIAPIPGERRGCGVAAPVRVTEVAGVRLSTPATLDCDTARALHTWMERGARPAVGRAGGGLAAVQVAAHYACRTRNNRPGARISEHGRGKAIDISALILENGQRITVLHGWRSRQTRRMMRQMHAAACGPFGTVLGPNSDRFHQDHFHFDTARYRTGPYCR